MVREIQGNLCYQYDDDGDDDIYQISLIILYWLLKLDNRWFDLVSFVEWHINLCGLFNSKAILVEE